MLFEGLKERGLAHYRTEFSARFDEPALLVGSRDEQMANDNQKSHSETGDPTSGSASNHCARDQENT
jgi:hypothetical protein